MKKFLTVGVDPQEVYLARDVDARIDELERALKSCVLALGKQASALQSVSNVMSDALEEAYKALALRAGS